MEAAVDAFRICAQASCAAVCFTDRVVADLTYFDLVVDLASDKVGSDEKSLLVREYTVLSFDFL